MTTTSKTTLPGADGSRSPFRASDRPAPAGALSMAEPVTRHAQMTDEYIGPRDWRFLICGIDTLDLGIYVDWKDYDTLYGRLETGKSRAQGNDVVLLRDSCIGAVLIHAGGKGMYRYHVQTAQFHMFLQAQDKPKQGPNVYVSVLSRSLWTCGLDESIEAVRKLIDEWDGRIDQIQPSRVDLAADYVIPDDLSFDFLKQTRVARTSAISHFEDDDALQTFYIGKKHSTLQARIYDKGIEIMKNRKAWFTAVWGLDNVQHVWRVEFQIRRIWLKEFGIDDLDSLKAKLPAMWDYLTVQWLSFRLLDDSNTARRTVHHWWQHVQSCADGLGQIEPLERITGASSIADAEWYIKRIASSIAATAGLLGLRTLPEAMAEVWERVAAHWELRGDFENDVLIRMTKYGHVASSGVPDDEIPF